MIPIGTIVSLAGQAASGIMSALNNKKIQSSADAEAARQVAYNEARAYEDPLARSENQKALREYDRSSEQQIENARNVAAITGATPEFSLGVQKSVANGRADLMGGIAADASKNRDSFLKEAENVKHEKFKDDQARRAERDTTYATLASNAANAFGSILDSYTAKAQITKPTADEVADYSAKEASTMPGKAATSMAPTMQGAKSKLNDPSKEMDMWNNISWNKPRHNSTIGTSNPYGALPKRR